jgi:hypothetical protein
MEHDMSDPLEYCLKTCEWFARREVTRVDLYSKGRLNARPREDGGTGLPIPEQRFWAHLDVFGCINIHDPNSWRTRIIDAGVKLGASPVEMSRLLDRIYQGVWEFIEWDKNCPRGEHEAWDVFEEYHVKFDNLITPIRDLCELQRLRRGKPLPDEASSSIVSHGDRLYSIGKWPPVEVLDPEDDILQAFLQRPTMNSNTLAEISGYTPEEAVRILRSLIQKYGKRFMPAIRCPGHKSNGGYHVRIHLLSDSPVTRQ